MQEFDANELFNCLGKFFRANINAIPGDKLNFTMEARVHLIGTGSDIRPIPAKSALLYVFGVYKDKNGSKPIKLYCDPTKNRAWPGGTGYFKTGS